MRFLGPFTVAGVVTAVSAMPAGAQAAFTAQLATSGLVSGPPESLLVRPDAGSGWCPAGDSALDGVLGQSRARPAPLADAGQLHFIAVGDSLRAARGACYVGLLRYFRDPVAGEPLLNRAVLLAGDSQAAVAGAYEILAELAATRRQWNATVSWLGRLEALGDPRRFGWSLSRLDYEMGSALEATGDSTAGGRYRLAAGRADDACFAALALVRIADEYLRELRPESASVGDVRACPTVDLAARVLRFVRNVYLGQRDTTTWPECRVLPADSTSPRRVRRLRAVVEHYVAHAHRLTGGLEQARACEAAAHAMPWVGGEVERLEVLDEDWRLSERPDAARRAGRLEEATTTYAYALRAAAELGNKVVSAELAAGFAIALEMRQRAPAPPAALKDSAGKAFLDAVTRFRALSRALDPTRRTAFYALRSEMVDSFASGFASRLDWSGLLRVLERGRAITLRDIDPRGSPRNGGVAPLIGSGERGSDRRGFLVYHALRTRLIMWSWLPGGKPVVDTIAIGRCRIDALVRGLRESIEVGDAIARGRVERDFWACGGPAEAIDAAHLASLLLPPDLAARLTRGGELTVVAHGALTVLPFAMLPVAGTNGEPLGARYALRTSPSLSGRLPGRSIPGTARPMVVGNPRMPLGLRALPGAATEATRVASLAGVRALTGRRATEAAVLARLPTAPIIHIASHGFAESDHTLSDHSFVALAPDANGGDGLLTVAEILRLDGVDADIVTLSACQTGLGSHAGSEGVVGLSWAFLGRGARRTLVSLWNVSDRATTELMTRFYQEWLRSPERVSAPEALRRAVVRIRRTPAYREPRYWAAFQLMEVPGASDEMGPQDPVGP